MKYKAGDMVRIKSDLKEGELPDGMYVNDDMVEMAGKIVTIEDIQRNLKGYKIKDSEWTWTDDMFDESVSGIISRISIGTPQIIISRDFADICVTKNSYEREEEKMNKYNFDKIIDRKIDEEKDKIRETNLKLIKDAKQKDKNLRSFDNAFAAFDKATAAYEEVIKREAYGLRRNLEDVRRNIELTEDTIKEVNDLEQSTRKGYEELNRKAELIKELIKNADTYEQAVDVLKKYDIF